MKKVIWFIVMFAILFNVNDVFAANNKLTAENIEVECIYENNISITAFYSGGAYGMTANDVKLSDGIQAPFTSGLYVFYNEANFAKKIINSATCPSQLGYGSVRQWNGDGSASVSFTLYYHTDNKNTLYCDDEHVSYNSATMEPYYYYCNDTDAGSTFLTGKHVAGFSAKYAIFEYVKLEKDSILKKKAVSSSSYSASDNFGGSNMFHFNLVSERVYLTPGDVEPAGKWAYKSEGQQAASKVLYARLYKYKLPNNNWAFFLEKDGVMTINGKSDADEPSGGNSKLCFREAVKRIETGKTSMGFSYPYIRHRAGVYNTSVNCNTQDNFVYYEEVDWSEAEEAGTSAKSICEIIPNTAVFLAQIVNWARLIVPALLIVYTGIDISRIVIAGDIEEQLPKRRKNITIRAIVAIVFFFLPVLVQLVVASVYGVDFGDISCLWM